MGEVATTVSSNSHHPHRMARVLYDFTLEENDVRFRKGEQIEVLQIASAEWWKVRRCNTGDILFAPSMYLQPEANEDKVKGSKKLKAKLSLGSSVGGGCMGGGAGGGGGGSNASNFYMDVMKIPTEDEIVKRRAQLNSVKSLSKGSTEKLEDVVESRSKFYSLKTPSPEITPGSNAGSGTNGGSATGSRNAFPGKSSSSSSLDDIDMTASTSSKMSDESASVRTTAVTRPKATAIFFRNPLCSNDDNPDADGEKRRVNSVGSPCNGSGSGTDDQRISSVVNNRMSNGSSEMTNLSFDDDLNNTSGERLSDARDVEDGLNCSHYDIPELDESVSSGKGNEVERPTTPIYANFPPPKTRDDPPEPNENDQPVRQLGNEWAEYATEMGRAYYYNSATKQSSWKPPRRPSNLVDETSRSSSPISTETSHHNSESSKSQQQQQQPNHNNNNGLSGGGKNNNNISSSIHNNNNNNNSINEDDADARRQRWKEDEANRTVVQMENGWRAFVNEHGDTIYRNDETDDEWSSSLDDRGRMYFYDRRTHESAWELPVVAANAHSNNSETSPNSRRKEVDAATMLSCSYNATGALNDRDRLSKSFDDDMIGTETTATIETVPKSRTKLRERLSMKVSRRSDSHKKPSPTRTESSKQRSDHKRFLFRTHHRSTSDSRDTTVGSVYYSSSEDLLNNPNPNVSTDADSPKLSPRLSRFSGRHSSAKESSNCASTSSSNQQQQHNGSATSSFRRVNNNNVIHMTEPSRGKSPVAACLKQELEQDTIGGSLGRRKLPLGHTESLGTSGLERLKPTAPPKVPSPLHHRALKTRSMVISESYQPYLPSNEKKDDCCDSDVVTRQGMLNKTELLKSGRKTRKCWSLSFVVLTKRNLFIYRDINAAQEFPKGITADIKIDLTGALIDWSPDKSKRKNVFQVSTVAGQQLLLQDENAQTSKDWYETIKESILNLASTNDVTQELKNAALEEAAISATSSPKSRKKDPKKVSRNKSLKTKSAVETGSNSNAIATSSGDLATLPPHERKLRIGDRLRLFFMRRPTLDALKERGIFKDEPVFGCSLAALCATEKSDVPKFVVRCIAAIEKLDMSADGIYRASGNLSQVQKVRFRVNQDDYSVLDTEEDVHVLTGALKMFFRHMKEPLIPFSLFCRFLEATSIANKAQKIQAFKQCLKEMPKPNFETLKFLLNHLMRVKERSDENRMHVQNLAIVFGPSLLSSGESRRNIALDLMQQNQVIEFLLVEHAVFFGGDD